jgi:hypothetical protein
MTYGPPGFQAILSELSAAQLADAVVCAIEDRFGYDAVTDNAYSIPRHFRCVHIVYQTTGFVGSGGLRSLLKLGCRKTYPQYLKELGFHPLGAKLRRYVQWSFLYDKAKIKIVEQELYRNSESIYDAVGNYIVNHAAKFETLLPEIKQTLTYLEHFDPPGYQRRLAEPSPRAKLLELLTQGLKSGEMSLDEVKAILRVQRGG